MSNLFPPESFVVPREVLNRRLCQGEGLRCTDVVVTDGLYDTLQSLSLDTGVESIRVSCSRVLGPGSVNAYVNDLSADFSKYCLVAGVESRRAVPQSLANGFLQFSPGMTGREQEVRRKVAGFLRDSILQSRGGKKSAKGYPYEWLLNSGETYIDLTVDDLRSLGISFRREGDPSGDSALSHWIDACGEDLTLLLADVPEFANKRVKVVSQWKIASEGCFKLTLKLI